MTREREKRASKFGGRCDDGRRKRGPTAPDAHADMETRETRNASIAVVVSSDAREGRGRGRRALTAHGRETRANDMKRRRGDERRKRRSTAPEAHAEM